MLVTHQPTGQAGLTGIGYQGHDLDSFLSELSAEGVSLLVDVRLNPISRKRGFSKRALTEALASVGIEYEHARPLGNPKDNREGFSGSADARESARRRFSAELLTEAAQEWLSLIADWAGQRCVSLLCFEADQSRCHRDVVLAAIQARTATEGAHRLG